MNVPTTDSFMYQTMHRQPADIERLVTTEWAQAEEAAALLGPVARITLTGIGTSYHAALAGSWILRAAGYDARAVSSFDFSTYPQHFPVSSSDAVIVMAHTGVKSYSKHALDRAVAAGATVLSVGSQSADHPGSQLVLRTVEREKSAAYTASHLAAMTVLAQVAASTHAHGTAGFRETLTSMPGMIGEILGREGDLADVAGYAVDHRVYATGAGPNEATALEFVIKAREAAYGQVDALAAEQFLHGPIVAVNAGDLAIVVDVPGASGERVAEITSVLEGMGMKLLVVGQPIIAIEEATTFSIPVVPEMLSPLLTVVPMQMLAYTMAALKGINPDTFRRDDEIYKAAFARLTL
ncbi:MAG: SIS domain-containing protein [Thermomicrobiales bacterium]